MEGIIYNIDARNNDVLQQLKEDSAQRPLPVLKKKTSVEQDNTVLFQSIQEIQILKAENDTLKNSIQAYVDTQELLSTKNQKLQKELVDTKREFTLVMKEKDDIAKEQLFKLEQKHVQQLSSGEHFSSGNVADKQAKLVRENEYIDTIAKLNRDLDHKHLQFEKEKRKVVQQGELEVKRVSAHAQEQAKNLRSHQRQQEDAIEALKSNIAQLQNDIALFQRKEHDWKAQTASWQVEKANYEIKLKSKVPTNTSHADSFGIPGECTNTTCTSKIKQWEHKAQYLKAQIASEIKCKEELGGSVTALTAKVDTLKKEKKQALADVEEIHRNEATRVKQLHDGELDALHSEIAAIKSKVSQLQTSLQDTLQDAAMLKKKESMNKLTQEKMAMENCKALQRYADLSTAFEKYKEKYQLSSASSTANALEDAKRSTMEATLRRLDNERQYLNAQLVAETEAKQLAEASILDVQRKLQEQRGEFESKLSAQSCTQQESLELLKAEHQTLREQTLRIESENTHLQSQLQNLNQSHAKLREEARSFQADLENEQNFKADLKSKLIRAREELVAERQHAKSSSERQADSFNMIKTSMQKLHDENNAKEASFQNERNLYQEKLKQGQSDLQDMRGEVVKAKSLFKMEAGFRQCQFVLDQREKLQKLQSFALWKYQNASSKSNANMLQETESKWRTIVETTKAEYEQKARNGTTMLAKELNAARELALQQRDAEHQQKLERLTASMDHKMKTSFEEQNEAFSVERSKLQTKNDSDIAQLQKTHTKIFEQAMEQHSHRMQELEAECTQKIDALQQSYNTNLMQNEEMHTKLIYLAEQAMTEQLVNANTKFKARTEELVLNHEKSISEAKKAMICEKEELSETLTNQFEETKHKLQSSLETGFEEDLKQMKQAHNAETLDKMETLQSEHAIVLKNERDSHQKLIDEMQAANEAKHRSIEEKWKQKVDNEVDTVRNNLNEIKGKALMQCTMKWQTAMDELVARKDAELEQSYKRGISDREKEWQKAAKEIKELQIAEINSIKQQAQDAIKTCQEKNALIVEHASSTKEAELGRIFEDEKSKLILEQKAQLEKSMQQLEEDYKKRLEEKDTEMQHFLEQNQEAHEDEIDDLKAHHANAMSEVTQKHVEEVKASIDASKEKAMLQFQEKEAIIIQNCKTEESKALSEQEESFKVEMAAALEEQQAKFDITLEKSLDAFECDAMAEQRAAVAQVQDESEQLIAQVELAMVGLKSQKDQTEQDLQRLEDQLLASRKQNSELEQESMAQLKRHGFHLLSHHVMFSHAKGKYYNSYLTEKEQLKLEYAKKEEILQDDLDDVQLELDKLRGVDTKIKKLQSSMRATLVEYKRDELLQHRVQSKVVVSDLSILRDQKSSLQTTKEAIDNKISTMETNVQSLESEIDTIQKQKSIQDGKINTVIRAKKRRLHEEIESILEDIQQQTIQKSAVDTEILQVNEKINAKEAEIKLLERQLAQILVEQQKQMLTILDHTNAAA